MDGKPIGILAYVLHAAIIDKLGSTNPMLTGLQATPRDLSPLELSQSVTEIYKSQDTTEWGKLLARGDYPKDFFVNFGCLGAIFAVLMIPTFALDFAANWLTSAFLENGG